MTTDEKDNVKQTFDQSQETFDFTNYLVESSQKYAEKIGIFKNGHLNFTEEENKEYIEFLRRNYVSTSILTEKGISALMSDHGLAGKMFEEAIMIDSPKNDYWYQYFCLGVVQLVYKYTEEAKETFKKLQKKNPHFKDQMSNIFERVSISFGMKDKFKEDLKIFIDDATRS